VFGVIDMGSVFELHALVVPELVSIGLMACVCSIVKATTRFERLEYCTLLSKFKSSAADVFATSYLHVHILNRVTAGKVDRMAEDDRGPYRYAADAGKLKSVCVGLAAEQHQRPHRRKRESNELIGNYSLGG
jgi:hypothetical protein